MARALSVAILGLGLLVAAAPGQAEIARRFASASIACSDDKVCVASIEARGDPRPSLLALTRGPETRARWTLSIATLTALADPDRALALSIDNGVDVTLRPGADFAAFVKPGNYYLLAQAALDRLMIGLPRGHDLRVSYLDIAGAPHTDRFPLDGLADALNAIDDAQGRVRGDRRAGPPTGLPPADQPDAAALIADAGIPEQLMAWHLAASQCEAPDSPALKPVAPVIGPLSDTATLYAIPCFAGALGTGYRLYMAERGEIGGLHLLSFAGLSRRFGWIGSDLLADVAFRADDHVLTGQIIGDDGCRGRGTWTWDAFAFRLDSYEVDRTCPAKGAGDWERAYPN